MNRKVLISLAFCLIIFSLLFILVGCTKDNKNSNPLIGVWVSDWRQTVDLEIVEFKEDGSLVIHVITDEDVNISDGLDVLKNSQEYELNYTYKVFEDYFMIYNEENEEEKVEYKFENNNLNLTFDQAGYSTRSYEKLK